jgi:hypothetical protein
VLLVMFLALEDAQIQGQVHVLYVLLDFTRM